MKNLLIASAAAAALLAVAPAANAASGFVDLSYASVNDHDADVIGIGGSVVMPAGSLNLQFDAGVSQTEIGNDEDESFGGAAHLFTRNDSWALGGFASYADPDVWSIGIEGAKYYENVTLNGRFTDIIEDDGNLGGEPIYIADVGVKYFATENFTVGGSYFFADSDSFGDNVDGWGLDAEVKLNNPLSLTASYLTSEDADADVWAVGLRWNFGTDTLKQRDREGASMGNGNRLLSLF